MNGMTAFLVAAGALLIIVLGILLRPLLRTPNTAVSSVDRRRANLSILREELRELERNRDDGALSEDDFEQARRELQRRLLEETTATEKSTPPKSASSGRSAAIALLIALPLAAAGGYAALGNPQGLDAAHTQARMSPQEVDTLLQRLAERLKANPGDTQGWIMLARSYKAMGRYAEAVKAFAQIGPALDGDAVLLAANLGEDADTTAAATTATARARASPGFAASLAGGSKRLPWPSPALANASSLAR